MPRRWSWYDRMNKPYENSLHKLLGELEVEIMEQMWQSKEATVRDVASVIQERRQVAYTTVMTVMSHLADKGLLNRTPLDKKTHLYSVAMSKEEFMAHSSQQMVHALVTDFGDLALAQFLDAVGQADPEHLKRLRKLSEELKVQPDVEANKEASS